MFKAPIRATGKKVHPITGIDKKYANLKKALFSQDMQARNNNIFLLS